ncbi:MAG: sulfatase, partial [Phycisphaerae bacterium]
RLRRRCDTLAWPDPRRPPRRDDQLEMRSLPMNRRDFLKTLGMGAASLAVPELAPSQDEPKRRPNFIIFFTDDQGYNDVGCFGSPLIRTPRFDRMAAEGMRFTSFYAQAVCGPSRAAIMTGCYPIRVAEPANRKNQHTVLHPREITLAELLKGAGYATACIGKWHLAGNGGGRGRGPFPPELMPDAQGFDHFFGTPMHNGFTREPDPKRYVTELMRGGKVVESPADMNTLTQRYTAEATGFIRANRDRPFFLYLSHNMPHVPLGASAKFRGRSKRGLYGDVIEELDFSAGQVLDTLKELGLDEDTLVVFTSDNGPWIEKHIGDYAGSADPLRGSKMMTWDGGPRVPAICRWPGKVPAGKVCDEVATTMDLLPTFARLAGAKLPDDRIIDGEDLWPLLSGAPGAAGREAFYFYCYTHLQAVRCGKWKLVLPRPARPGWTGWSARMIDAVPKTQLYDLDADIAEKHDLADKNPAVVARLMKLVADAREDLGDYDRVGKGARFFDEPAPKPGSKRGPALRPRRTKRREGTQTRPTPQTQEKQ